MPTDTAELAEDIRDAQEALLRALARLGLPHGGAPLEALDVAIQEDLAYRDARDAFREAMESGSVLDVEATHHQAVATAVEVGWLLATSTFPKTSTEAI